MKHTLVVALALLTVSAFGAPRAMAQDEHADLRCKLSFSLHGWSAVYSHAEGKGVVSCKDGTTMPVLISVRGGGLTAGRSEVDHGTGDFTHVRTIDDVLGRYAQGEAHAGVMKSGTAQVLTKGTVSLALALAGAGEGIDLGVDVGELTLKPAK
ncbi:MAG TPA: hypothetical protein VNX02_19245 [Steroidobacteraceae bacterium]|jgi:hypothetical protein|nr:hypothetical protein [Steroidobacteraceae bacterium]